MVDDETQATRSTSEEQQSDSYHFADSLPQLIDTSELDPAETSTLVEKARAKGEAMDAVVRAYRFAEQIVRQLEDELDTETHEDVDVNSVAELLLDVEGRAGAEPEVDLE